MKIFKRLLFLLSPQEKIDAGLLLIMIVIMAFLDAIGIASILPFMAVLTNESLVDTNFIFKKIFEASNIFGVENNEQFLFFLGLVVFFLLIVSLTFKIVTIYMQIRFVQMREHSIGKRLMEVYLNQPYSWFLSRHSSDLGKTILSEVQQLIAKGMGSLMELVSKGMVATAIIILLILVDLKLAITVGFSLLCTYGMIFFSIRIYLNKIGKIRLINNELRFKAINEAFSAIKDVKFLGLENICINLFSHSAKKFANTQASSGVLGQIPRFILEAIAFGGILIIILFIISRTGNFNNALPILSLYVFAAYRLMPAIQQIYNSLTNLTFIAPSIDKIYNELNELKITNINHNQETISFNKSISLENIFYNYPNSSSSVLKDININIPAKSTIGLVGATGSGKTTTVDIILGLLEAQKGNLKVDGKIISKENLKSWQKSIGYVPQHIYLSDNTIESNIAFGIELKDINEAAVKKAAKISNLHTFVTKKLPKQYKTIIGENGVRLSGGQRQRIGIARALYHNPKILVFDEATSALDNQTEKAVMDAVNYLSKEVTIILIAHRLGTVKNCDKIFILDDGKIINEGKFDELFNNSETFRKNAINSK